MSLEKYTSHLLRLKRGGTKHGLAPHKPLLLLVIIDLIEEQGIYENRILLEDSLFKLFATYWRLLAVGDTGKVLMPLHYLKNDGLWRLIGKNGRQITNKIVGKTRLAKTVDYGQLDQNYFQLLQNQDNRDYFRTVLLDTYFPDTKENYNYVYSLPEYIHQIELDLLQEPQAKYKTSTRQIATYMRDWKFRSNIMKIYNDTCCISKLQVKPSYALIEACHIIPHAKTGNQHIQNGMALSVLLHRAFDAGIISIGSKYQVLVKDKSDFKENEQSPLHIRQFKNQRILLPKNELYYPSQKYLAEHRTLNGF